ncbi:Protein of unknown function [Ferrimonas sediminum]|uniref:DUF2933 domain-containing protein n=1 Tax=Ferrimonas sediminum TaxID=718193 RepID=A0A1G8RMW9_9GAMM|nr:DUF2933 domain-containing protein [Ferrimonas sediminum]SDJ17740.1 Protein of unknown function [Ferrimonas sediminum]
MAKRQRSFWSTPQGWAAIGLIASVSYFLLVEHRQHLFEFLPFLILLACPLMHIFMHRGHGHHHTTKHGRDAAPHKSFEKPTRESEAYRDGFIEGLKSGREEREKGEDNNER